MTEKNEPLKVNEPLVAKLHNIVDMSLGFSGMIRLFETDSKKILRDRLLDELPKLFSIEHEKQFTDFHATFCEWGTRHITLTEKKRNNVVIKPRGPASYGQIAKTLDVVLKVVIYYCRMPDSTKSEVISEWLNAAVDTRMMKYLKPKDSFEWPLTIEDVDHYCGLTP